MLAFAQAHNLSEPSLWTIVIVLAGIVAALGKAAWRRLNDCEDDRKLLHKKVGRLEVSYAILAGKPIEPDNQDS